jgi:hypothetical protein
MVDPLTTSVFVNAAVQAVKDAGSRVIGRNAAELARVEVSWSQSAIEDMRTLDRSLTRSILLAAVRELKEQPDPSDPDEGRLTEQLLWRRAVVPGDEAPAPSEVEHPEDAHLQSYVLIYRPRSPKEKIQSGGRPGFVVLRVIPTQALSDLMSKADRLDTQPNSS